MPTTQIRPNVRHLRSIAWRNLDDPTHDNVAMVDINDRGDLAQITLVDPTRDLPELFADRLRSIAYGLGLKSLEVQYL